MQNKIGFDPRGVSRWSTLALALLIAASIGFIGYQGHLPASAGNERHELQERLGTQATAGSENLKLGRGNEAILATADKRRAVSATWSMSDYEFAHVLPRSSRCSMALYVIGPNVTASDASAWSRIELNGRLVTTLRFRGLSAGFPAEYGRLAPADVMPVRIPMSPLFRPYGLVFPLGASACRAVRWDVRITVYRARWPIERVGIFADFSPPLRTQGGAAIAAIAAAFLIAGALLLAIHLLFDAVARRYGFAALALVLFVFVCALATHDEWDFAIWLRFVDLMALGHGNPAYMWAGSPLWPFMTGLFVPLLSAVYAFTGDASQEVTALFIKLAMALAMCGNAFLLAAYAPPRLRRFLFAILLLSPLGLYELAGGYREILAGSFVLLGCGLLGRSRYAFAAFAFACGASISESLLPLIFLPAATVIGERSDARRIVRAGIAVCAGALPIAFEWIFLIPHSVVSAAVGTRLESAYRYGGGSWLATLDGFGLLPRWVGRHSLAFVAVIFFALAVPLLIRLAREIARGTEFAGYRRSVFGIFVGLVAAFFLAYRGVDPATWYALFAIAAFYFVRFHPTNPFLILLSALQGFAYYAILGVGDFANWTYLVPLNRSLLGVLGTPMLVAVLAVNVTIFALYVACLLDDVRPLFGRGSSWFLLLFFGAAANGAIQIYPTDIGLCVAAATLILIAFHRLRRLDRATLPKRYAVLDYAGIAGCIVVGTWTGAHDGAAALVAFDALLLGLIYGFGACDLVLAFTGPVLLASQPGFGWVSIAGWIALSLVAVAAVRGARGAFHVGAERPAQARPALPSDFASDA